MLEEIKQKFAVEKGLFVIIILAVLIVFGIIFYLFFGYISKRVVLLAPNGGSELELGKEYEIKWSSRGVDKVGIILFNGNRPEWIAQNVPASQGSFRFALSPAHESGSDFWLAVFDYPWRKGSSIDYSDSAVKIVYSKSFNCDELSLKDDWPYLASNSPGLRKVFVTSENYAGDLGGFDGADKKCRDSAQKQGYEGNWVAFLGGDKDEETAVKRLEKAASGTKGFFVDAKYASEIAEKTTCHRLLGNSLADLLDRLNKGSIPEAASAWVGRISDQSKKTCVPISSASSYSPTKEKYSYTVTCQNWSQPESLVSGYSEEAKLDSSFPSCYTSTGQFTYAVGLGGLGINSISSYCSESRKLICIQD